MKFLIRIYGPKDPFHKRKSYFLGDGKQWRIQISIKDWTLMFGMFDVFPGEPVSTFMFVNDNWD